MSQKWELVNYFFFLWAILANRDDLNLKSVNLFFEFAFVHQKSWFEYVCIINWSLSKLILLNVSIQRDASGWWWDLAIVLLKKIMVHTDSYFIICTYLFIIKHCFKRYVASQHSFFLYHVRCDLVLRHTKITN